jgi:hypothetical protein
VRVYSELARSERPGARACLQRVTLALGHMRTALYSVGPCIVLVRKTMSQPSKAKSTDCASLEAIIAVRLHEDSVDSNSIQIERTGPAYNPSLPIGYAYIVRHW